MRTIVLFIVALGVAVAQPESWETVSMVPSVMISDLRFLDDGQHGWAVGTTGAGGLVRSLILATTDGGEHWGEVPFPDTAAAAPNGVFFVSADVGWIVGSDGFIRKTTDAGATWLAQTSPVTRTLGRVHFVSDQLGWTTGGWNDGSSYLVLRTTDGGANWQDLSFGSDCYSCEDVWFADAANGWLVGQNSSINPFIKHTTDGGATWVDQNPRLPSGNGPVSSVCFPTPRVGWASTSSIYQSPAGSILHTTNGGDSWYIQGNTNLHYNYALDAPDTLHAAILSTQVLGTSVGKVFRTTNGGVNWSSATLPTYNYGSGCQYRGSDIWVGQEYTQILHSPDNGATWDWQFHAPLWRSVGWSSQSNGWLIAGSSTGSGYCLRTTDGGTSWSRDPSAPGGTQVQFISESRGWTLLEGNGGRIYRTTDAGLNWAQFNIGASGWVGRISFATADSGWACGSQGTMRVTGNGGASWTSQNLNSTAYCSFVQMIDTREGWAAGGYGGGSGFIRHTTDGGANWQTQNPAQPDHFNCGHFLDNQRGWLGTIGGLVHSTTDGGQSWQIVGSVPHDFAQDIIFRDAQTGWLAAYNPSGSQDDGKGFIYRTTNGGITWVREFESPWPKGAIMGLGVQPGGELWACGQNATLLRSPWLGVEQGVEIPHADGVRLEARPNPFVSATRISYTIQKPGTATLVLFDAAGSRLAVLADGRHTAGRHSVTWDGAGAARGVYFCRLDAAGQRTTVKFCRQ